MFARYGRHPKWACVGPFPGLKGAIAKNLPKKNTPLLDSATCVVSCAARYLDFLCQQSTEAHGGTGLRYSTGKPKSEGQNIIVRSS